MSVELHGIFHCCPEFSMRLFTLSHQCLRSLIKQHWKTSEMLSVLQGEGILSGTIKMAAIK